MGEREWFPVLTTWRPRDPRQGWCFWVEWAMLAAHEPQAKRNHGGQSLERLAQRGGLGWQELYYVLRDEEWPFALRTGLTDQEAEQRVRQLIRVRERTATGVEMVAVSG